MRLALTLAAAASLALLQGCTYRITDFTVISTKSTNIPAYQQAPRVTGTDCALFFIIPIGLPKMKTAIDNAIESAGPQFDALIDGVVYLQDFSFVVGKNCFKVEGTPISTKAGVPASTQGNTFFHSGTTPVSAAPPAAPQPKVH